jgi:MinD-like ATPase involved in chromosome partitioning or flagellar assembly
VNREVGEQAEPDYSSGTVEQTARTRVEGLKRSGGAVVEPRKSRETHDPDRRRPAAVSADAPAPAAVTDAGPPAAVSDEPASGAVSDEAPSAAVSDVPPSAAVSHELAPAAASEESAPAAVSEEPPSAAVSHELAPAAASEESAPAAVPEEPPPAVPEEPPPAVPEEPPPAVPEEPPPAAVSANGSRNPGAHRSSMGWVEPGAIAAQRAQRARLTELAALAEERGGARVARGERIPPRSGWRHLLYVLTRGWINVGEGPSELRQRSLTTQINQPLFGCYRIAMLSLKGGVGKTTVTATLGATFASLRGDRVIAVDANPDRGTLSQKIPLETTATVRHLLRDAGRIRRYTDVRAYTSQGPSRLEVLASEQDPAVSEAFSEAEYRRTVKVLEHFYNLVLTDCGTGLMHSAMYGVLGMADALVIVSSGSIDGARSASATMDWLDAHGHRDLVANSIAVINAVRRPSGNNDLDRVAEHFAARCRAVVRIPHDSHLEEGTELDLDKLSPATRIALFELAAAVADGFPGDGSGGNGRTGRTDQATHGADD